MTEISNFSESTITYLHWSPEGDILFVSSSNGSLFALEFNEYSNKAQIIPSRTTNIINNVNTTNFGTHLNIPSNPLAFNNSTNNYTTHSVPQRTEMVRTQQCVMRRITPTLINSNNSLIINQDINSNPTNITNLSHETHLDSLNPNKLIQDCLRCHKQKLDSLQTKISKIKLNSIDLEKKNVYVLWENKVCENYSYVQLLIENTKCLFVNKLENKLIRLFSCNNFCYAVYDAQNLLSVFTLFSTIVFLFY